MADPARLARLEDIVDASGVADVIEALLPTGGRPRQLPVRSLLLGLLLALSDSRPAQLTRVHAELVSLPPADKRRLRVVVASRRGPHTLTYRQVERTFALVVRVLDPSPVPSFAGVEPACRIGRLASARAGVDAETREARLGAFCDALVEASVPPEHKAASASVAVDWTDYASFARGSDADTIAADADASWGHRKNNSPGGGHEAFFGYYAQAVTMVAEEGGDAVPELVRRVVLQAPSVDPPSALVATLRRMTETGIALGDVLADCGYSHRVAERWAGPLRGLGARLVQDLHPHDRGPRGTHEGAICANGQLYCPATPPGLLALHPAWPGAGPAELAAHDAKSAELAAYKLGRISADDDEGYHRVGCPAAAGKLRCALKPDSMTLGFERPEVLTPPSGQPPRCCAQITITVPPSVNAKTRQKHDYPSLAYRRSYARRTGVERSFSTLKDPASTDVRRGWCRLMGRTKNLLMLVCAVVVRNLRVLASFQHRQAPGPRPEEPRRRKRRRPPTS